ncbi:hypothetical protein T484DRAFT_1981606 [Baffinella frigidus]|nr:hypothetical protein T484DRAFT_1981606 [Cryptophyta sp. CCMP2293]
MKSKFPARGPSRYSITASTHDCSRGGPAPSGGAPPFFPPHGSVIWPSGMGSPMQMEPFGQESMYDGASRRSSEGTPTVDLEEAVAEREKEQGGVSLHAMDALCQTGGVQVTVTARLSWCISVV